MHWKNASSSLFKPTIYLLKTLEREEETLVQELNNRDLLQVTILRKSPFELSYSHLHVHTQLENLDFMIDMTINWRSLGYLSWEQIDLN